MKLISFIRSQVQNTVASATCVSFSVVRLVVEMVMVVMVMVMVTVMVLIRSSWCLGFSALFSPFVFSFPLLFLLL